MKFSRNLFIGAAIGSAVLTLGLNSWAGEFGERGGGESQLTEKQQEVLRDLLQGIECKLVRGTEFANGLPYFAKLDTYLRKQDPSLAFLLKEDLARMIICITARELKPLPRDLQDGVTLYNITDIDDLAKEPRQIAIRSGIRLYIDGTKLPAMDDLNQSYLLVHEELHSVVPFGPKDRMTALRNFVATIRKYEKQDQVIPVEEYALLKEFTFTEPGLLKWTKEKLRGLIKNQWHDFVVAIVEDKFNPKREILELDRSISHQGRSFFDGGEFSLDDREALSRLIDHPERDTVVDLYANFKEVLEYAETKRDYAYLNAVGDKRIPGDNGRIRSLFQIAMIRHRILEENLKE